MTGSCSSVPSFVAKTPSGLNSGTLCIISLHFSMLLFECVNGSQGNSNSTDPSIPSFTTANARMVSSILLTTFVDFGVSGTIDHQVTMQLVSLLVSFNHLAILVICFISNGN